MEYFFENVKNGDIIGFHYKKWYYIIGKIINFFSYKIKSRNLLEIEHVGMIYNVERGKDIVTFSFGESVGHAGGRITTDYTIIKNNNKWVIDSRFKNKNIKIYLIPTLFELNRESNNKANDFWNFDDDYIIKQAVISVNWFQKLFPKLYKNKTSKDFSNYCMGAINAFYSELGYGDNDIAPSPAEITTLNYIDKDNIRECKFY